MRGENLGSLHGLPIGIKDVTVTAGIRTTFGSPLFKDNVPSEDAEVVRRLKAAGAIVLAKTNTPEFATGANTVNELFGATRNPWNPELSPAGSSGGSAVAVATGMLPIAQGTDFGCSIRIPAAFCGIVGIRPTPGPDAELSDAAGLGPRPGTRSAGSHGRRRRDDARCHGRLQPTVADLGRAAVGERAGCGEPNVRRKRTAGCLRLGHRRHRRRCGNRQHLPAGVGGPAEMPARQSNRSPSTSPTAAIRTKRGGALGWLASSSLECRCWSNSATT